MGSMVGIRIFSIGALLPSITATFLHDVDPIDFVKDIMLLSMACVSGCNLRSNSAVSRDLLFHTPRRGRRAARQSGIDAPLARAKVGASHLSQSAAPTGGGAPGSLCHLAGLKDGHREATGHFKVFSAYSSGSGLKAEEGQIE